ncbi:MAG: MltA domain-containing protein [Nitrospirae bacterium]|nr:MltA domain-containing protein [Nitrospirota bacterium]
MRKIFILLLLVILTTSCAVSQANQPSSASNYSLVYVDPPHAYGNIDRKALREAIITNLSFLHRIDPETEFDYGGKIVRAKEVENTQKTLLQIIDTAESNEMIELLMDYMFEWYKASGENGTGNVTFTGYYVPEVEGSLHPSDKYRYPLYRPPDDLKKDSPYFSRIDIDGEKVLYGRGLEIAWLSDPVEAYFLHIQGSGTIRLPDGSKIGVHYAGNNGHSYTSIGKLMLELRLLKPGEANIIGLKKYLWEHPEHMSEILYQNPRYIFFKLDNEGAKGSIHVLLTPGHSIATDPSLFPRGGLSFIKTTAPVVDQSGKVLKWEPVNRFVLNQDEGGAIKGPGRVDLFWGAGTDAEFSAGSMKERGELYFILQK